MKVLIISTDFMNIAESYKNAFVNEGHETLLLTHKELKEGKNCINKVFLYFKRKLFRTFQKEHKKEIDKFSGYILEEYNVFQPDLIIDLLGCNLNREVLNILSKKTVIIKYMLDCIKNYPYLRDKLSFYDAVPTYERDEIERLIECGAKKSMLVFANYDSNIFNRLNVSKKYDISFVGKMFTKEQNKRLVYLNKLSNDRPNLNCVYYGVMAKPYQVYRYIQWMFIKTKKGFKNINIDSSKVNEIYNMSRICINISSYQTKKTWSSRLLEMLGSGSFTLSEYTEDSYATFKDGVVFYNDYNELLEKIDYYIAHEEEREKIATIGHEKVMNSFTIKHSIRMLINMYYELLDDRNISR